MEPKRLITHQKNEHLEHLLREVNGLIQPAEIDSIAQFSEINHPLILINGVARSGTTLFMQWLASLGCFAYPSNLLSRFYAVPYIGAKIQLILTKYDFNNEIFNYNTIVPFESKLGKTIGALAPNEFWYFWKRFIPFQEIQKLSDEQLSKFDVNLFVKELAAIESVFNKPFAMKGICVNWNIEFMNKIVDKIIFIHISRDPISNALSLLQARKYFYGDINAWYSFKPPEYVWLKKLDPYMQVAGQVYYTNLAISDGLRQLSESNKLEVKYEDFCTNPESVFNLIKQKLKLHSYFIDCPYQGPKSFGISGGSSTLSNEADSVRSAFNKLTREHLLA